MPRCWIGSSGEKKKTGSPEKKKQDRPRYVQEKTGKRKKIQKTNLGLYYGEKQKQKGKASPCAPARYIGKKMES
jgi:hypothetical protein